jgi:dTDP-4-dehydrorhamnose reductase
MYRKDNLAGEQTIRASCSSHLIFRTARVRANHGVAADYIPPRHRTEELRIGRDQISAPTRPTIAAAKPKILTGVYR